MGNSKRHIRKHNVENVLNLYSKIYLVLPKVNPCIEEKKTEYAFLTVPTPPCLLLLAMLIERMHAYRH